MKKCLNAPASVFAAVVLSCALVGGVLDSSATAQETKPKAKAKDSKPAVFSSVSFEEARKSTEGNEKILIVKGTAEWCGPCKQMDKTTWKDEAVVKWMRDNGLVIAVDVDKEEKVARKLSIQAMPTMIAFKDGKEVDRIVGYRSAKQLLSWASDVKAGKTTKLMAEEKLRKVRIVGDKSDMSMQDRLQLAGGLVQSKRYDDATTEYVWLWRNMAIEEPAMSGVRVSFMPSDMERLASMYEPAKAEFTKLRDETEGRLKGADKSFDDLRDWLVLNDVLKDEKKTLEWFDRIKDRPTARSTFARVDSLLEQQLKEAGRIADLGFVIGDPVGRIRLARTKHEMLMSMPAPETPGASKEAIAGMLLGRKERALEILHEECAGVYQAMLAAKRDDAAVAVAVAAIDADDTCEMRVQLVQAALDLHEAREAHVKMLTDTIGIRFKNNKTSCDERRITEMLAEVSRQLKAK